MTILRRNYKLAPTCALAMMLAPAALSAQDPAIRNRVPANPSFMLSVPDTAALWEGFAESPVGKSIREFYASPAIQNSPEIKTLSAQLTQLEKGAEISLWPEPFLTKHLQGVDVYVVEQDRKPELFVALKTREEGLPQKLIDQMKVEVAEARGVAGSYTADTVSETQLGGKTLVSFPAFDMHFMADSKTVLLWSTSEEVLASALEYAGEEFLTSDYFQKQMSGLENEASTVWMVGDAGKIAPLFKSAMANMAVSPSITFPSHPAAYKLHVTPEHFKLSSFVATSEMEAAERRLALAAPPPGDITVFNFFPDSSLYAFGTNFFDGIALLDVGLAALQDTPNSPVSAAQVEQQLQGSRQALGFDIRNDLLANLGPNLGFGITRLELPDPSTAIPTPKVDVLLVTQVKNHERFEAVMKKIEGAMEPPQSSAPQREGAAPPTSPIKLEEWEGKKISYYESPQLVSFGIKPSYMLTKDNYFLLTLNPDSLKEAVKRYAGSQKALLESPKYQKTAAQAKGARNSFAYTPVGQVASLLNETITNFSASAGMTEGQRASMEMMLSILEKMEAIARTTTYERGGKKTELVITM